MRNRQITARVLGRGTLELVGHDKAIAGACRDTGARFMRHQHGGAWLVRGDLADDVEALLVFRGFDVQGAL